jgi:uncharacterized protein YfaS (alpha-2-macroglobulin family)
VEFSDPVNPAQDFNGMIYSNASRFTFVSENNIVKAYPVTKITGNLDLIVMNGIKNIRGNKLQKADTVSLFIEDVAPQLRAVTDGTIIPASGTIAFPFEAINLNAVDVQITKVFENNVLQFLQDNQVNDHWMHYVGRIILEKKVSLNSDPAVNLTKWNRHAIDLAKLIRTEPGAIYKINVRFRKDYSLYECSADNVPQLTRSERIEKENEKFWDYYENWDYDDNDGPCSDQYYRSYNNIVSGNLLASDFGIVAKCGTDNRLFTAVSDLATAEPLKNLTVEYYSLEKQLLRSFQTDNNGFIHEKFEELPYFIVAKRGKQRGYLKLDYQQWSTDRFEVSGEEYEKGLKGFIYGDRGVWRPGDSIFISFIMEDRQKVLPPDHPVVFQFYNPKGILLEKRVVKAAAGKFFTFPVATEENAPTGHYLVRVIAGGASFEKNIKVETIIPNRLKIKLNFEDSVVTAETRNIGALHSNWLHGAPADGMRASVSMSLRKSGYVFPGYKGFTFEDPLSENNTAPETIFDGNLNRQGETLITIREPGNSRVPGVMTANFYCKVFEPGGNFSTDNFQNIYHPFTKYAGIKAPSGESEWNVLLNNKDQVFEIATVSRDGKPADESVTVELYKLEWKWWWEYYEDLGSYNGKYFNEPLKKEVVKTLNGRASWTMKTSGSESGRYLVRVCCPGGHCSGVIVSVDNPGWYSRRTQGLTGTTLLEFSSDKIKYLTGEKARLEIPSELAGKALVTIENGTGIIKAEWLTVNSGKSIYTFSITPEMSPNCYASVMLIQKQTETDKKHPFARKYGIIPIQVENPGSHLYPVVSLPPVLKPEKNVTIKVSEKKGQPMTYTIAMVDEGLLDITKFRTPDPWKNFNAKQALQIKTWDMYDFVMSNQTSKLKKLLSIGGDYGEGEPGKGTKLQRFRPMVKFIGPFTLPAGQTTSHTFTMPEYIGSVRTMVIAAGDKAYGTAEVTTPVKNPLMVLATLPRVLGPGESTGLPVSVFAEPGITDVVIEVKTDDLLPVQGPTVKTVRFADGGEELVTFPVKVKEATGTAKIKVIAKSGKETAIYDMQIIVRPSNPVTTEVSQNIVKAGKSAEVAFRSHGIKGTNAGKIEISSVMPVNLQKRLDYLIQYPHGCVEQTTSSVFPQLALNELTDLSQEEHSTIQRNIKAAISRLYKFQQGDGGLGYWPAEGISDEWGTNYAGHFLIEASRRGYNVSGILNERWKAFQKKKANSWSAGNSGSDDLTQAYRLYLLALAGQPELAAMNRMKEVLTLSVPAKWYLAAAWHMAGQKSVAAGLIKNLALSETPQRDYRKSYGSQIRNKAVTLEALAVLGKKEEAEKMASEISSLLASDQWLTTQETAFCIIALSKYYHNESKPYLNIEYRINKGNWNRISGSRIIHSLLLDFSAGTEGIVEIKNAGTGKVYVNTIVSGIPFSGYEKPVSAGILIKTEYKDLKGNLVNPGELQQGTDFIAEIKVENTSEYPVINQIALSCLFPSGWQIHNPRLNGDQYPLKTSQPEYMDIRDDRIYYYFDFNGISDKQKIFRIALNASYQGNFYMPSITAESMYDNRITATVPGKWVKVTQRNQKFAMK